MAVGLLTVYEQRGELPYVPIKHMGCVVSFSKFWMHRSEALGTTKEEDREDTVYSGSI